MTKELQSYVDWSSLFQYFSKCFHLSVIYTLPNLYGAWIICRRPGMSKSLWQETIIEPHMTTHHIVIAVCL